MTEHNGLPVHGYQPQSDDKVALVNRFKEMEERLLRELDALEQLNAYAKGVTGHTVHDPRWLAIARTGIEQSFMALNRSVFQPQRVKLPEDEHRLAEDVRAALNDIA